MDDGEPIIQYVRDEQVLSIVNCVILLGIENVLFFSQLLEEEVKELEMEGEEGEEGEEGRVVYRDGLSGESAIPQPQLLDDDPHVNSTACGE